MVIFISWVIREVEILSCMYYWAFVFLFKENLSVFLSGCDGSLVALRWLLSSCGLLVGLLVAVASPVAGTKPAALRLPQRCGTES